MKKTALFVFVCLAVSALLCSCGTGFDTVRRGFEDAGFDYTFVADEYEVAVTVQRELDEAGISYNAHYFTKSVGQGLTSESRAFALVIEFESGSEKDKAFSSEGSATLRYLIEDPETSDHVLGNCVLVEANAAGQDLTAAFNAYK